MKFKKIWPLLALLGVAIFFWVWHLTHPQEQDPKEKAELSKSAQDPVSAPKIPVAESPSEPAGGPGTSNAPGASPPETLPVTPEKPPAPATKVPTRTGTAREYSVKTKKFRTFPQAKKFLGQLRKQGHKGYITKSPKEKKPFTVWLGPYNTLKDAQAEAKVMQRKCRVSAQVRAKESLPPK